MIPDTLAMYLADLEVLIAICVGPFEDLEDAIGKEVPAGLGGRGEAQR